MTYSSTDNSTDDTTKGETLDKTDNHTGNAMNADQVSGDDNVTEQEHVGDQQQQTFGLVGTDANGNTFNLTDTSNSSATENITAGGDVSETPAGITTETSGDHVSVDGQDTETLSGTISTVNPSTGVTTSTTVNDTFTNTLHDQETDGDTAVTPPPASANSAPTDTPTTTEGGTDTQRLQLDETVTNTNPDGTAVPVSTTNTTLPQSVHADMSDAETSTNGTLSDAVTFVDSTGDNAPTFSSGPADFTVAIGSTPTGLAVAATGNSGDPVTYSISGTSDATIDPTTGILTFTGPVTTCSDFSVIATDTVTGSSTTNSVHINAVDANLISSCFAPGTPIRVPGGFKKIEDIQAGDYVLARDEHRPDSPVVTRRVELVFQADGQLCELTIAGRTIRTTPEHRFHLHGGDWVVAKELQPGSKLSSLDGPPLTVDSINPTPILTRVHNMRVAEDHTYFVGEDNWSWSVWAHNECGPILLAAAWMSSLPIPPLTAAAIGADPIPVADLLARPAVVGHHPLPVSVLREAWGKGLISDAAVVASMETFFKDPGHLYGTYGGVTHDAYIKTVSEQLDILIKDNKATVKNPLSAEKLNDFLGNLTDGKGARGNVIPDIQDFNEACLKKAAEYAKTTGDAVEHAGKRTPAQLQEVIERGRQRSSFWTARFIGVGLATVGTLLQNNTSAAQAALASSHLPEAVKLLEEGDVSAARAKVLGRDGEIANTVMGDVANSGATGLAYLKVEKEFEKLFADNFTKVRGQLWNAGRTK